MKQFRKYSHLPLVALLVLCWVADVSAISGCGSASNNRAETIHAMVVSVDAARDGFLAWDKQVSKAILDDAIAKATTVGAEAARAEALVKLDAHDKQVDDIIVLFKAVRDAAAFALKSSDEQSLKDAVKKSSQLLDAIAKLKGKP